MAHHRVKYELEPLATAVREKGIPDVVAVGLEGEALEPGQEAESPRAKVEIPSLRSE